MGLRLDDQWTWDSWVYDDGETYHLYFLQAPRALEDPSLRHTNARVGHATSTDLTDWTYRGPALGPSDGGWDDLAIWTGSVVADPAGGWLMFYTAIGTGPHGLKDQRIGVVHSDDLHRWERVGDRPVLEPGGQQGWYETLADDPSASETWRDPFVFADPDGDGWHALFSGRAPGAPAQDNGIIGHARSTDLRSWQVQPPLSEPGSGFGEIEVVQVRVIDGQPVLTFCCHPYQQSEARRAAYPFACTWTMRVPGLLGPFEPAQAVPFLDNPYLFAAPLVQARDGGWVYVGFENREQDGILSFEIVDPIPVELGEKGLRPKGS